MGRGSPSGTGRLLRLVLALSGILAVFAVTASVGQANFTTAQCGGNNVTGDGASFQNAAQQSVWKPLFNTQCGGTPTITYLPNGSGEGVRRMGVRTGDNADGSKSRNQGIRFGATDDPPNPTDVSQMNQGTDASGDEGTVHVIPVAVGAVPLLVNFPDGCPHSQLPAANRTDTVNADLDRVRFTRAQFEQVWVGDSAHDQWPEIFPTLTNPACNEFITRVVRFDSSGTTYAFKDYLNHLNAGTGWLGAPYVVGSTNTTWPNASVAARTDCNPTTPPQGPTGAHLTSGCANGNGSLVDKLKITDGAIGYSDVATARSKGLDITPGGTDNDTYWTQAQSSAAGNPYREATNDPNGFKTTGLKGANCETTTFVNVPASTLNDWSTVSGADSATGFGICTLTYELAWDDYKGPYSLEGAGDVTEEKLARTVKDYLETMVSDDGQENLFGQDYAELPTAVLTIARTGVNAVCWNKPGGACPPKFYTYARPKAAGPLYVSLVPALDPCTASNRTHAAPWSFGSCNPPVATSQYLTMGTPDANGLAANAVDFVKYGVTAAPDVSITVSLTDVRKKSDLSLYNGSVRVKQAVQLTDKSNGRSGSQSATVLSQQFDYNVNCGSGTCSAATTINAIVPGLIKSGAKRAIWQLGQVSVDDGGADNNGSTTGDNTTYLKQGFFIP